MNRAAATLLVPLVLIAGPVVAQSPRTETRLVIIGGGDHPPEAMTRLVAWAGGPAARVLVVPWASGEPKESCDDVVGELKKHGAGEALCAPSTTLDSKGQAAPLAAESRRVFLDELARATGVFFTGGDQVRVMDVLADLPLLDALKARHASGVVFSGTSAGAAIMSERMITGEGDFDVIDGTRVEVRRGLGLLPGTIVDQHFVKRQRENRLFGLVLLHPEERGVGINEATAILVTNGRHAEVVGVGPVMLVDAKGPNRLEILLAPAGAHVDLAQRP